MDMEDKYFYKREKVASHPSILSNTFWPLWPQPCYLLINSLMLTLFLWLEHLEYWSLFWLFLLHRKRRAKPMGGFLIIMIIVAVMALGAAIYFEYKEKQKEKTPKWTHSPGLKPGASVLWHNPKISSWILSLSPQLVSDTPVVKGWCHSSSTLGTSVHATYSPILSP